MSRLDFRYLDVEVGDGIAVIRMKDPVDDHFLAELHPMHTEIRDIFPILAALPEVEAVVLTGSGDTFFAGPGLEDTERLLTSGFEAGAKQMREARQICNNMIDFPKPIVSALNGAVIGMGCQLAFLCDFAVALRGVRIQDSHVRLGLPAGDGGTMMWPILIGLARARALLLRGHPLDVEEAHALGLVSEICEDRAQLLVDAVALASKLRALPRFAYAATRLALGQWMRLGSLISSDMATALELAAFSGDEFRGGIRRAIDRSRD